MIKLKINLSTLNHGLVKGKTEGETLICIPIQANKLFLSEKGNVFFDIVGFDYTPKDKENKDTHLLKQSFSKEVREAMSEKEREALPIIGNASVSSGGRSESEPNNVTGGSVVDGVGDLPF
jgi:hypothetical protein